MGVDNAFGLLVAGGGGGELREVRSPYSGDPVGTVTRADTADVERAIATARATFDASGRALPAWRRAEILHGLADRLTADREALALGIAEEGGKPLPDALVEASRCIDTIQHCAHEALALDGSQVQMDRKPGVENRLAIVLREPIGVVGAISAFNHPLNLIAHQVGPAIAAGCPVVLKPASTTPLSAHRIATYLLDAGLPPAWLGTVACPGRLAEPIGTDPRIGFVTFIGSGAVGWGLRSRGAPGIRYALEHGGVAPAVLCADANLDKALPRLIRAGYYHAGQVCVSLQRLYVHRSRYDEVVTRFVEAVGALVTGDPTRPDTDVGPIITQGERERVHTWVHEAVAAGATLHCGGETIGHGCYAPTVLTEVREGMKVVDHEVFGPVVCIQPFDTLAEAIARANRDTYGFQSCIFTQDIDRALEGARGLQAAAVMVNDHPAFRVDWMPFGGRGESGLGMGGPRYAVHEMTHTKLVVIDPGP